MVHIFESTALKKDRELNVKSMCGFLGNARVRLRSFQKRKCSVRVFICCIKMFVTSRKGLGCKIFGTDACDCACTVVNENHVAMQIPSLSFECLKLAFSVRAT